MVEILPDSKKSVTQEVETERLVSLQEVEKITGFRSSFLYSEIKNGNFPKPIKINTRSRWVKSQIDNWVRQKINQGVQK